MILSKFSLSIEDMKKLGMKDDYSVHRIVYDLFEKKQDSLLMEENRNREFIYFDEGFDRGTQTILILSSIPPMPPLLGNLQSKVVSQDFLMYQSYHFEVLVNPSYRCHKTSKIVCIRGEEELLNWFCRKAETSWGFSVNKARVKRKLVKKFTKKGDEVTIGGVVFTGELFVKEREKFIINFQQGLGRGKAWGFGLLQLYPINNLEKGN